MTPPAPTALVLWASAPLASLLVSVPVKPSLRSAVPVETAVPAPLVKPAYPSAHGTNREVETGMPSTKASVYYADREGSRLLDGYAIKRDYK